MSRPSVLAHVSYSYPQQPFDSIVHPALSYRPQTQTQTQTLPVRPPELSARYNHHHPGHHRPSAFKMSGAGPAYMASDDELAQLQKLSQDYEPETTGPLVGERQSSSAITTEYANADPIYKAKTAALPSKYAYFRTCRGDGHCGWRAIAFTYFETLLHMNDVHKFEEEEARLRSMNNLLNLVGFQEHVYIDFVDECFELLRKLAEELRLMNGTAADTLLQSFNDMSVSMAIITYFKLLASAHIQTHSNDFEPFLYDQTIREYCSLQVESAQCEVDHLGITALAECLIKPAGFALEVNYLDRSEGTEINQHRFETTEGLKVPTMRLLYRPGHYDILYKAEDVAQPAPQPIPSQAPLHVALAGYTDDFVPMASSMSDVMTMIPGLYPTGLGQKWPSVSYDYNPNPTSQPPPQAQPQPQVTPVPTYSSPAPIPSGHQEFAPSVHSSHVNQHPPSDPHSLQLDTNVGMSINHPPLPPMNLERVGPFRPSIYELEPRFQSNQTHALPFQTAIFRNSHYNTAHFMNPDFQPEEWSPDTDYSSGNRGRHKSTSQ